MQATIRTTFGMLAKIAESSPGYSVQARDDSGKIVDLSNIRFDRRPNGRRDRANVRAECNRKDGLFFADSEVNILD